MSMKQIEKSIVIISEMTKIYCAQFHGSHNINPSEMDGIYGLFLYIKNNNKRDLFNQGDFGAAESQFKE